EAPHDDHQPFGTVPLDKRVRGRLRRIATTTIIGTGASPLRSRTAYETRDRRLGRSRGWRPFLGTSRQALVPLYTDYRSLEYFMSTKVLTAKQVRWMELLADFNFCITYTAGKNNQKADILSRREQDLVMQQKVKLDSRARVLLGPARLNHRISAELADSYIALINALEAPASQMPFELIEALCANNRKTFTDTRAKTPLLEGFSLKDQLLLYKDRLCVNRNTELCTRLIREAHNQVSVAHLSGRKTY
ncbi:hypothetical protein V498_01844, partial [Pseudogymnoascus sp. VKM F-4517 (FW-2822)]